MRPDDEHPAETRYREWLKTQVTEGRFESIEEILEVLVAEERSSQARLDATDLSWAKPYIDEGLADLEAGRAYTAEHVHAEIRALFSRPKRS